MLIMIIVFIVYVLKTLSRYIPLTEWLCSVNYIQPHVFQFLEEISYDIAEFRGYQLFPSRFQGCQLFPDWFQIVFGCFQVLLDGFSA